MDGIMASNRKSTIDFESRFLDLLQDRLDRQDDKLDQILVQAQKTNGRVNRLEDDRAVIQEDIRGIKSQLLMPTKPSALSTFFKDPKVLMLILYIVLIIAGIGAAVTGVKVSDLL